MFFHGRRLLLAALVSIALSACMGKPSYTYNGIAYESPDQAFAAQKSELNNIVNKITPTNKPISASAVIILPSRLYWERNFPVAWKYVEPNQEGKEKANTFFSTITLSSWHLRGEAIEKRRIFNSVVITSSDEPVNASFNEDVAVLLIKKDGNEQWFMKKKHSAGNMKAIEEISPALPPVQRLIFWLNNVENLARQE